MRYSNLLPACAHAGITLALCTQMIFAQGQAPPAGGGGTPTPGGGAGGGGAAGASTPGGATPGNPFPGNNRTNQPTFPSDQNRNQFPAEMQRPLFFSGKVVLDDGTPPPESLVIELVCNGNPRPQAYTDSKGRFQFQVGQNNAMMADASVGNSGGDVFGGAPGRGSSGGGGGLGMSGGRGITERDLMGCELRAALPGYRSEAINLSGRRSMDNPDVGTIILRRLANVEGLTFSATSAAAPKDAKKAFEKGRELARKKKFPEAQKEFEKAVAAYPKFANAWSDLGRVHEGLGNNAEALKAYQSAIAADGKLVEPYVQMSFLTARENKWQECAENSERALKLNPYDFPQAYFYNAVANLNLQNLEAAEKSAREGVKSDAGKRFPKMRHVLGIILAQKNDVPGAMEYMKGYLSMLPDNAPDVTVVKGQIAQLEKFAQSNQPKPEVPQQQQ